MKKINSLEELEELIGPEAVEKCFTEYMMLLVAKARKWDELQGKRKGMATDSGLDEGEDICS